MDFDTLAYLRDHSKFTGLARLLLIELELFATKDSHTSYPSIERLAHDLGVTPRRIQQILRTLIAAGAVRVIKGGGRGRANCYQLCQLPETVKPISGFLENDEMADTKPRNLTPENPETHFTPNTMKERKEGRSLAQWEEDWKQRYDALYRP